MTLELRNVSKRFPGVLAVDNVSFSARAGEITGYLGPNGSGKSTTMKMIAGLIGIGSGEILFGGEPIRRDLIAHKRRTGYVPEEPYLYAHLSGLEYLIMVADLRGLPAKPTGERIDGLLRLLSSLHLTFWLWIFLVFTAGIRAAVGERDAFESPAASAAVLAGMGIAAVISILRSNWLAGAGRAELRFEEERSDRLLSLDLSWDGGSAERSTGQKDLA